MVISTNNFNFTDNSSEANEHNTFVISQMNEKYIENAKENKCNKFITSNELKDYFDFNSIKIIGITGTNGKTTTACAIYSILLDLGYKVGLQGTRGFFVNDKKIQDYTLTTPMQLENFSRIQIAIEQKCDFFITEVSSHGIYQNRIEGLKFDLKIHTNITQDHLDFHKTIKEYIETKNSFFNDDSPKLINKDDPVVKFKMKNAYSYGLDNNSTYKVLSYSFDNEANVSMKNFSNIVEFTSSLMGLFNVYNMTAAIAAVHICTNKPLQIICDKLKNFAGVAGRMEIINYDPFILVDFAHTPDAMKKVFDSFLNRNIIVVFGAGGNRDRKKRKMMGTIASNYSKYIYITSDNPRFEDPEIIAFDIISGIMDKNNFTLELNRKIAIHKAILKSKEYNMPIILILGKGDEEFQIIYDQKLPFNDKKIILNLLNENKQ